MSTQRALVVAIERYRDPRHNLNGLFRDVQAFVGVLAKFGITNVEVLRDENATAANVQQALNNLVSDAMPGDVRVFYWTGHGCQVPKTMTGTADDPDGKDEALVPWEGTTDSLILDNSIAQFLDSHVVNHGFAYYGIYDCCNSGDIQKGFDLALEAPRVPQDAKPKTIPFEQLLFTGAPTGFRRSAAGMTTSSKSLEQKPGQGSNFHISAAESDRSALVMQFPEGPRSVFTWALEQVTHRDITLDALRTELAKKQAEKTDYHKPQFAYYPPGAASTPLFRSPRV